MMEGTEAHETRFDQCLWAIHPGSERRLTDLRGLRLSVSVSHPFCFFLSLYCISGPMILTAISDRLGLSPLHTQSAWTVLRKYGNMSSATLIFVLRELLQQYVDGEVNQSALPNQCSPFIPSLAFGPGLNIEGCILKVTNYATVPS